MYGRDFLPCQIRHSSRSCELIKSFVQRNPACVMEFVCANDVGYSSESDSEWTPPKKKKQVETPYLVKN